MSCINTIHFTTIFTHLFNEDILPPALTYIQENHRMSVSEWEAVMSYLKTPY